jgi:hypothetical protein
MRKVLKSWPVRIGALVLAAIVLYGSAYSLLPRTADSVSVTVLQCATVQSTVVYDCPGTTLFHRTFVDEVTVAALRTTLDAMHEVGPFITVQCTGGWGQSRVYIFDLLWHGKVVQSYAAPTNQESRCWWEVTTLGVPQAATEGATTWMELVRLTGMPDIPIRAP